MSEQSTNAFQFGINWKVTFFSVCLLPLLITLGFWQLDRAKEKQMILDLWETRQALPPLEFDAVSQGFLFNNTSTGESADIDQRFRKIRVTASFDADRYWLLEGKTYRGQVGYQVVMPAKIDFAQSEKDQWILVNRGWVKGSAYRSKLPTFHTPLSSVVIDGNLVEPANALFISEADRDIDEWPSQVLEVNTEKMSKQIAHKLHSKIIQIDPESPHALTASWPKVNVLPEKHQAYAFQWFAMGLALFVLWLVSNTNIVPWVKAKRKA